MRRCTLAVAVVIVALCVVTSTRRNPYFLYSICNQNFRATTQVFPREKTEYGIMQFDRSPAATLSFIYINAGYRRRVAECETPRNWLLV